MQRLILFDVDQTLLSTRGGDRKALNTAFREMYGIDNAFEGVGFGGRMDLSIMAEVYRISGVPEGDRRVDEFKGRYFEHLTEILPKWDSGIVYPGVRELLGGLGVGVRCADGAGDRKLSRGGIYQSCRDTGWTVLRGGRDSGETTRSALQWSPTP